MRAAGSSSSRRRPVVRLVQVVLLACLLVVAAIALSRAQADDEGPARPAQREAAVRQVDHLLGGVPQRGTRLGWADAPVVVTVFVDLQCPYCRQASQSVLPQLINGPVRSGRARLELRTLSFIGEDSVRGARAAHAAATSDRMWNFTEQWYADQGQEGTGYATDAYLTTIARRARVAPARALDGARSRVLDAPLAAAQRAAEDLGVEGTPTFVLGDRPDSGQIVPVDRVVGVVQRATAAR